MQYAVGEKYRKISVVEKTYLFHDKHNEQPIVLNAVLEGTGEFNLPLWQEAMKKVAAVHPGCRLRKKGNLGMSCWAVTEPDIPVTLIENSSWDGMSNENADFLKRKLSPITGPTCEVVLVKSDKLRVVFRAHHAIGDASGLRYMAADLFKALRGEEPVGVNSNLCDVDVLNFVESPIAKSLRRDVPSPTGSAIGAATGLIWRRKLLRVRDFKLSAKVLIAIKKAASQYSSDDLRIRLTVDTRRHLAPDIRTTANCSGAFDISVSDCDTILDLVRQMKKSLSTNEELAHPSQAVMTLANWIPSTFHGLRDNSIRAIHQSGRYFRSGTVTKVDRFNKEDFCAAGFSAETAFALPPPLKLLPFFMTLWPNDHGIEMIVGMPTLLGNEGRLENFMNEVARIVESL